MSYAANEQGRFDPEYAEVYGVPFSFIPCSGATVDPKPGPMPTRVRALESRIACEITFPRLLGYRYDIQGERLTATFTEASGLSLSTADVPTKVENAPIVGESSIHDLDDLKKRRLGEVAFRLAKLTLERYFRDNDGNDKPWLFPQLLGIAKRWLDRCVTCKDHAFKQLLLLHEWPMMLRTASTRPCQASEVQPTCSRSCGRTTPSEPPGMWISTPPGRSWPRGRTSATSPMWWPTPRPGSRRWPRSWRTCPRWSAT